VERDGRTILLAQPQTYMNASGEAVAALTGFYRAATEKLLVAVDDADLPLGQIRLRGSGSSGGHHGLESIEAHLATRDFARLRIGIGRTADGAREITGYVLAPFAGAERDLMDAVYATAGRQVETWLEAGIGTAMSQFNGAVKAPDNKAKETK
jgi:PTH1 family peptidyl-tRNA hydrolase